MSATPAMPEPEVIAILREAALDLAEELRVVAAASAGHVLDDDTLAAFLEGYRVGRLHSGAPTLTRPH